MQGWGATDEKATLTSIIGLVHVMSPGGQSRRVLSGQSAFPGETVVVGPKSETDLTLPDGSSLSLSSGTKLKIASLKQPSAKDKNFLFTLDVGKLFVQVKKLLSSKSSFEINAGGVICGVRGTSFNLGYNPENHQLDLDVYSGTVGTTGGGNTQLFTGGQHGHFVNGTWDGKIGTAPPPPNGTKGGTARVPVAPEPAARGPGETEQGMAVMAEAQAEQAVPAAPAAIIQAAAPPGERAVIMGARLGEGRPAPVYPIPQPAIREPATSLIVLWAT